MPVAALSIPIRGANTVDPPADINAIVSKLNELCPLMAITTLGIPTRSVNGGDPAGDVNLIVAKINELVNASNTGGGGGNPPPPGPTGETASILSVYVNRQATAGYSVPAAQQTALVTFIDRLKADNLWSRIFEIWPVLGGTGPRHALGLKNQKDLVFNGGWTHSALHMKGNGTTGYASTGVLANGSVPLNDLSLSVYLRSEGTRDIMGATSSVAQTVRLYIGNVDSSVFAEVGDSAQRVTGNIVSKKGLTTLSRPSATEVAVYRDGAAMGPGATVTGTQSGSAPDVDFFIGALHSNKPNDPVAINHSNAEISYADCGLGLTASQAATYAAAVEQLQADLGRSVLGTAPNQIATNTMRARLRNAQGGPDGDNLLLPGMAYAPLAICEGTLIDFGGGDLRLFHTCLNNNNALDALGVARGSSIGNLVLDAEPVLGQGYGGVSSNVHGTDLIWDGTTLHLFRTNGYGAPVAGLDRNTYYHSSLDRGETWTSGVLCLDKNQPNFPEIVGYGNTGICPTPINGKYVGLIEAMTEAPANVWKLYRMEATSLAGPWTITTRLYDQLKIVNGNMVGGASPFFLDGVLHLLYHAGTGAAGTGNLPTGGAYSNSVDGGYTWRTPERALELPSYPTDTPYPGTDQIADVSKPVTLSDGKTYVFASIGNNAVPSLSSKLIYWRFNGTLQQLVAGLPS